jgi:uncharacterized membrane protein
VVPPNAWYGFRTAKTMADERLWYAANRTAGRDFSVAGLVICIGAVTLFAVKDRSVVNLIILNLAVLVAAIGAATIHSFYQLSQISKLWTHERSEAPDNITSS